MNDKRRFQAALIDYATTSGWALLAFRVALGLTCTGDVLFTWLQVKDFVSAPQLFTPGMTTHLSPLDALPPGAATTSAFFLISTLGIFYALGIEGIRFLLPCALAAVRHRVPMVENGGMAVLQLALVCTWMMPINTPCSLRAWWRARRRSEAAATLQADLNRKYVSLGMPLICLQLAVNYGYNAYNKLTEPWTEGIALSRSVANPNLVHGLGVWFADLPASTLGILNHGALFVEFLLPLLLLAPVMRKRALQVASVLMLGLHSLIAATLMVGVFSYAMMCHIPLLALAHYRTSPEATSPRGAKSINEPREKLELPWDWVGKAQAVFAAAFLYLMAWSLDSMWHQSGVFPLAEPLRGPADWLRLRQGWGMFAHPLDRAFLTATRLTTEGGRTYDPWRRLVAPEANDPDVIPRVAYKRHGAFDVDAYALASAPFRNKFANWLLARARHESPHEKVASLSGWTLEIPAEKEWLLDEKSIDAHVESFDLPLAGRLEVTLHSSQIWHPERMIDGSMVPEGTPVLSPVGSSFAPGCAYVTLHLDRPRTIHTLVIQADAFDRYMIEGSVDGTHFEDLGRVPSLRSQNYRTRVVPLSDAGPWSAIRLSHRIIQPRAGFISEVALFAHPITLPQLPRAPSKAHYVASYDRPAAMGLFGWPNRMEESCPIYRAEAERARAETARAKRARPKTRQDPLD